jgi:hypothetical protein
VPTAPVGLGVLGYSVEGWPEKEEEEEQEQEPIDKTEIRGKKEEHEK